MSEIHLCIDMQNYYKQKFSADHWSAMETNILFLAGHLDQRNIPTVYVGYDRDFIPFAQGIGPYSQTPSKTSEIIREYSREDFSVPLSATTLVAYKRRFSAFQERSIADYIESNGYSHIILSGIFEKKDPSKSPTNCVSATVSDFAEVGYEVTIAAEATNRGILDQDYFLPLQARRDNHIDFGVAVTPIDELVASLGKPSRQDVKGSRDFTASLRA